MTETIKPMTEFAYDLVAVIAGRKTSDELRENHPRDEYGEISEVIWGNLEHYFADVDIREKDSDYAHMQIAEIRKLVNLLESGGSLEEFSAITFLREH